MNNYVAVKVKKENFEFDSFAETDNGKYIGQILWYTVSEMSATREQIQDSLSKSGLPERYLPKLISVRDAFRKATTLIEKKKISIDPDNKKYLNILVREVKSSDDVLIRQVVREIVDAQNVRLEYTPVANLKLEGEIYSDEAIEQLNAYEYDALKNTFEDFKRAKNEYDGRRIREIVQNILGDCYPVALRPSGGVHFVPQSHYEQIVKLSRFLSELMSNAAYANGKTKLYHIPLIDTAEQRDMIRESLEEQTKKEGQMLIEDLNKAIQSGAKITKRGVASYMEQARRLKDMVKKYEDMLETKIFYAQSTVQLVQEHIKKMLQNVEIE